MKHGFILPLLFATTLSGCSADDINSFFENVFRTTEIEENEDDTRINKEFSCRDHMIEFSGTTTDKGSYWVRNGYKNNDPMFNSYWSNSNVKCTTLDDISCGAFTLEDITHNNSVRSTGAEIVSYYGYCYGYFGTRMKTFSRKGSVQSFFTYNGPTSQHPEYSWDEIDIEFLGKDTTKVQFNYFDDGVGGHEYIYELGFDSKDAFHDYGFVWEENLITWFVDFEPVYQVQASLEQWGFVMMNVWGGNPDNETTVNWIGKYETELNVEYKTYYDYVIASEFPKEEA